MTFVGQNITITSTKLIAAAKVCTGSEKKGLSVVMHGWTKGLRGTTSHS